VLVESCVRESANTDEAWQAVIIDTEEVERESGSREFAMNDRLCNDGVMVSKPGVSFATLSLNVNVSLSLRLGSGYMKIRTRRLLSGLGY
jgi:hypothetical protein